MVISAGAVNSGALGGAFKLMLEISVKKNSALEKELKKAQSTIKQLGTKLSKANTETKKLTASQQKQVTVQKKVNTSMQKGAKTAGAYGKKVFSVGSAFKTLMAYGIAGRIIMSVTQAFTSGWMEIIKYDQALKNLQAITGATDNQILAMGETIKDVATTTKFSTAEVGKGMVLLSQSGFDAGESMAAMQSVADLATGTLSSMVNVTDLLTTSIRAFGLEAVESKRVADVMANAVNKSKLTVDKMRIAFNFVGASASLAGVSIEETAASMMVLANNGIRASTIGTGMRQVLKRLIAPNQKLRDAYEQSGIELDKINPKTVGYEQVLMNLTKVLYNAEGQTVNMARAFELFGLRGAQAASILVKEFQSGRFSTALKNAYNVGTAAEMAARQFTGLEVSIKNLKDVWGVLFVTFGESGLKTALATVLDGVRALLNGMVTLAKGPFTSLIMQTALWTAGLFALSTGLAVLIQGLKVAVIWLAKFGAFAWMYNPWILVAVAIGAVTAALWKLNNASKKSAEGFAVEAIKLSSIETSLQVYSEALKQIYDDYKKDKATADKYLATLERLKQEYPELTKEIVLSVEAHEKNLEVIRKLTEVQRVERLKLIVKSIEEYGDAVENAAFWSGLWKMVTYGLGESWEFMGKQLKKAGELWDTFWEKIKSTLLAKAVTTAIDNHPLIQWWLTLAKVMKKVLEIGKKVKDEVIDVGMDTKGTKKVLTSELKMIKDLVDEGMKEKKKWEAMGGTFNIHDWVMGDDVGKKFNPRQLADFFNVYMLKMQEARDAAIAKAKHDAEMVDYGESLMDSTIQGFLSLADDRQWKEIKDIQKQLDSTLATMEDDRKKEIEKRHAKGKVADKITQDWLNAMLATKHEAYIKIKKLLSEDDLSEVDTVLKNFKLKVQAFKKLDKEEKTPARLGILRKEYEALSKEIMVTVNALRVYLDTITTAKPEDYEFLDKIERSLEKQGIELDGLAVKTANLFGQWTDYFENVGIEAVNEFSDILSKIGDDAYDVKEAFKDMARSILEDLAAMIIKTALFNALFQAGGSSTGGFGGFLKNMAKSGLANLGMSVGNMFRGTPSGPAGILGTTGDFSTIDIGGQLGGNVPVPINLGGQQTQAPMTINIQTIDAPSFAGYLAKSENTNVIAGHMNSLNKTNKFRSYS